MVEVAAKSVRYIHRRNHADENQRKTFILRTRDDLCNRLAESKKLPAGVLQRAVNNVVEWYSLDGTERFDTYAFELHWRQDTERPGGPSVQHSQQSEDMEDIEMERPTTYAEEKLLVWRRVVDFGFDTVWQDSLEGSEQKEEEEEEGGAGNNTIRYGGFTLTFNNIVHPEMTKQEQSTMLHLIKDAQERLTDFYDGISVACWQMLLQVTLLDIVIESSPSLFLSSLAGSKSNGSFV